MGFTSPSMPAALLADPDLSPAAKLVWLALAGGATSTRTVAEAIGVSRMTAHRAWLELSKAGWEDQGEPLPVPSCPKVSQAVPRVGHSGTVETPEAPSRAVQSAVVLEEEEPMPLCITPKAMAKPMITVPGETVVPPVIPPDKPAPRERVKPHYISQDWIPSEATTALLLSRYPGVDLQWERAKFIGWFIEKNLKRPGWDRSFMDWCQRASTSPAPRPAPVGGSPGLRPSTASGQRLMAILEGMD